MRKQNKMHHIIRMIVYEKTKEKALERAKQVFNERLVGENGGKFDYGTFFDDDDGSARWGNLPPVERVDSKAGKKLVDDGFKIIKKEFEENVSIMRNLMKMFSNEELFEGKIIDKNKEILEELEEKNELKDNPYWFKHQCWKISRGDWLFDNNGEPIENTEDLDRVLRMEYCEDKEAKAWVIPVDVHT